jgi:hypothetical protein
MSRGKLIIDQNVEYRPAVKMLDGWRAMGAYATFELAKQIVEPYLCKGHDCYIGVAIVEAK